MASEFHSSSLLINNTFNPYKSSAFSEPRLGSQRIKCRKQKPPPLSQITIVNKTPPVDHKLSTVNLLKSITSVSKPPCAGTTANQTISMNTSKQPSMNNHTTAFLLGSNKSYYSSTRSFSSKITTKTPDNSKSSMCQQKSCNGRLGTQLSTSSGTSSVESIVPKYNGFVSGSKKRIYSSVRITKKEMPYQSSASVPINSSSSAFASNNKYTANNNNKKQMKDNVSKINETIKNDRNGSVTSFSTKFPNGLPFENEFYHKRLNSTSTKSEASDYGSYDNDSDQSLLPFEDEFSRQRSSNEALYVDFSKPITTSQNVNGTKNKKHNFSDCNKYDDSSSFRNYVCNPDEVIIQDQPVVYVAVQWWASDCDQKNSNSDNNMEPIRTNLV